MSQLTWETVRTDAIHQFAGQLPRPRDETNIISHFERTPAVVVQAIAEMAASDNVKWKWSALASRLDRKPPRNPVVDTGPSREHAIRRADQWLRNAGRYYPSWTEVEDELFGERGKLRTHDTPQLRSRYRKAWESLQPQEAEAA